jgi:hypothetical protein
MSEHDDATLCVCGHARDDHDQTVMYDNYCLILSCHCYQYQEFARL